MSKSKAPIYAGLAAASGIGYYLYQAGGHPRPAEKKFESDVHKASADIKKHLPGRDPEAEKTLADAGGRAGAKIDSIASEADKQYSVTKSNVESYAKDAKANTVKAVNEFDRKVEDSASKAKTGLSSWFGSSK
ncbi:hypothetical protein SODALDRAFT_331523 [Sodiomyces alkalinus F11]|uniref:Calcofluor white hypersensitive protein n=1 Tax=Sodiomyces alkalinus (strain CBS 110278 / VKM F-3762 / F11) TaxID=1314773 RepID=A0A3N2Q545_SODAK|nr:hypothetical protein SODALDRAFT_331523 [Sodiomyces alkalinus F11]ROT41745.1 hypothetical protein SODALDRAFT_331523 [Sodiomyces alkalinus F11]